MYNTPKFPALSAVTHTGMSFIYIAVFVLFLPFKYTLTYVPVSITPVKFIGSSVLTLVVAVLWSAIHSPSGMCKQIHIGWDVTYIFGHSLTLFPVGSPFWAGMEVWPWGRKYVIGVDSENLKRCHFEFALSVSCLQYEMWALSCFCSHIWCLLPCVPTMMNSYPSETAN